jgi:chromosome segregation ATPase
MEDRAGPSMSTGAASKEAVEEALTRPIETMQLGNGSDASSQEPLAQSNGTANGTASATGIEVGPEDDGAHSASGMPSSSLDEDNGHASMHDRPGEQMSENELRTELERVRNERNSFEGQYRGLLNKLGQMRSTLGDRLRQDAEELDRREQQIETLTARVEELQGTVETLKGELLASHQDVDRLTTDLDAARSLHQQQTHSASSDRKGTEARLREVQEVAERFRIDAEGWESACMEERARRDEIDLEIQEARRERDEALAREQEQTRIAARETDTARELQQVLEEFQAAQEGELQRALSEHEEKLSILAASLEEHMARTRDAEGTASEYKEAAERCQQLEKEVKEKNLLIGKLRHEGGSFERACCWKDVHTDIALLLL